MISKVLSIVKWILVALLAAHMFLMYQSFQGNYTLQLSTTFLLWLIFILILVCLYGVIQIKEKYKNS
jgi:predicted membrane protein